MATTASKTPDGFELLDVAHRQALSTLGRLAAVAVRLQTQGVDAETRAQAAEIVAFFDAHERVHHADEELHVFPRLLRTGDADTVATVRRLQQDHRWLAEDWHELGPRLRAIAAGQGWVDPDLLREEVLVFGALLRDHIALEESCIYPQARRAMAGRARLDMGREMAARRRGARLPEAGSTPTAAAEPQRPDLALRALLLVRRRELLDRIDANNDVAPLDGGPRDVADRKDDAARSEADELARAQLLLERADLDEVDAALRRMDEGGYGRCADCGEPIATTRLFAHPASLRCTGCQALREESRGRAATTA